MKSSLKALMIGLLLFYASGVSACAMGLFSSDEAGSPRVIGFCAATTDCPEGQVCFDGYCRATGQATGRLVSLQFIPSPSTRLKDPTIGPVAKQQFLGVELARFDGGSVGLRRSYEVSGLVHTAKSGTEVPARLRFTNRSSMPGQPLEWTVETDPVRAGRYTVDLTMGTYNVEVFPHNPELPPFTLSGIRVRGKLPLDLKLPELSECVHVSGRVVTASRPAEPIGELVVRAVSAGGQSLSTAGRTDRDGRFTIVLPPDVSSYRLRVAMRTEPPFHPQTELPAPDVPVNRVDNKIWLGDLPLGRKVKAVSLSGRVLSVTAGLSVEAVSIIATGDVEGGRFAANGIADRTGRFLISLPAGNYSLAVAPTAGSKLARRTVESLVLADDRDIEIYLAAKLFISGRVCAENGTAGECRHPVGQVRVSATWQGPSAGSTSAVPTYTLTQLADSQGKFSLLLDRGLYHITLVPPVESGLARTVRQALQISRPGDRLDSVLPKANYLSGKIVGPDGFAIAGTTVELYDYRPSASDGRTTGTSEAPVLLGRTISDGNGGFSLAYSLKDR